MARAKKTIAVEKIKEYVNNYCLNSMDDKKDARLALGIMLENFLMDTNNYKGFGYLNAEAMKLSVEGTTVGINSEYVQYSCDDAMYEKRFENTDHSRVFYY